jgi:4-amino-4-deoxy-L-arabinose transferase-like glycosyltransferase
VGVVGQQPAREARLSWRSRPLDELVPLGLIALGLALGALSLLIYIASGYSHGMLWLWLAGVAVAAVGFGLRARVWPRIAVLDVGLAAGVAALCSPLYLIALYRWPVQVSSDEIAIMTVSKEYAHNGGDPFAYSYYLTRPAGLFVVWGKLGDLLGGGTIDLFHMRLLHAIVGLLTIAACYVLFRLLLPRNWAVLGALLVGVNHSMFMISRLAMRENTAVFVLVVALILLVWGFRHGQELAIFLGGFVAGLGFYVYYPARVVFPIWLLFLLGLGLLYKRRFTARKLLTVGAITTAGFALAATPIIYSESTIPSTVHSGQGDSLFIYKDARVEQQQWVFAQSEFDGWVKNIKFGLGTFNSKVVDHSWIYPNYGHGFLDPLMGILLWVGVAIVGLALIRRRRDDEGALLMLGGFLILWLSFAFLVNKAPNYTRLLITLPFVAYLVVEALRWATNRWRSVRYAPQLIVGVFVVAVVALNVSAARDYVQLGRKQGEPIGSTGRFAAARDSVPGQKFYVASSDAQPYYEWGNLGPGNDRLSLFTRPATLVQPPVDPTTLKDFRAAPPFALFMRREVWQPMATELSTLYPRGQIRNVTPDGARVVLVVPS